MTPIIFNQEDDEVISHVLVAVGEDGNAWVDDRLESIKHKIKQHYLRQQRNECCYCRKKIYTNHGRAWDTEHVIPRSLDKRFEFEPRNLAAACIDCNMAKRDKDVRSTRRRTFPDQSTEYTIVHPHFDDWDEHLEVGDLLYLAKTPKGRQTVYTCDLLRFYSEFGVTRRTIQNKRHLREVEEVLMAEDEGSVELSCNVIRTIIRSNGLGADDGALTAD